MEKTRNTNNKSKNKNMAKSQKGITLVALVITIIIIIILATVAINFAFGDNGLINRAEQAKDFYANDTKYTEGSMTNVESYLDEILAGERGELEKINYLVDEVNIGDQINYEGGGTSNWRVFNKVGSGKDGYVEIINMDSTKEICLSGNQDYLNSENLLNEKAKEFINHNFAESARSVDYNDYENVIKNNEVLNNIEGAYWLNTKLGKVCGGCGLSTCTGANNICAVWRIYCVENDNIVTTGNIQNSKAYGVVYGYGRLDSGGYYNAGKGRGDKRSDCENIKNYEQLYCSTYDVLHSAHANPSLNSPMQENYAIFKVTGESAPEGHSEYYKAADNTILDSAASLKVRAVVQLKQGIYIDKNQLKIDTESL